MGISRDSLHKRRSTGGKKKPWHKKRKYDMGRQPSMTKLSSHKTVRRVRVRGGNYKFRALRLDTGTYSWGSEAISRKCRILDVVYNASNNELVRTQTLVKNAIIQVDATPFAQWYKTHYGVELGLAKKAKKSTKKEEDEKTPATDAPEGEGADAPAEAEKKLSAHVQRKLKLRNEGRKIESHLEDQFVSGKLLASISSRPGQCGRCDGYILEGKELEFYLRKLSKKKGHKAAVGTAAPA